MHPRSTSQQHTCVCGAFACSRTTPAQREQNACMLFHLIGGVGAVARPGGPATLEHSTHFILSPSNKLALTPYNRALKPSQTRQAPTCLFLCTPHCRRPQLAASVSRLAPCLSGAPLLTKTGIKQFLLPCLRPLCLRTLSRHDEAKHIAAAKQPRNQFCGAELWTILIYRMSRAWQFASAALAQYPCKI